jgi:beta-1,4-N-acetylglucosaminyltransferase
LGTIAAEVEMMSVMKAMSILCELFSKRMIVWIVLTVVIGRLVIAYMYRHRDNVLWATLGSGGHTTEMIQLLSTLDLTQYHRRVYIVADSDALSVERIRRFEASRDALYRVVLVPRARAVGQRWSTTPLTALYALMVLTLRMLTLPPPRIVLGNGPGTCVPVFLLAYIGRLLGHNHASLVYVESLARVTTLSLSGKLLYPLSDMFLVQWPELHRVYPKAIHAGVLV